MGFLSGMLSPLLTATSQAVGGQQQGDIQGFLQKRKMDEQEAAAALKAQLGGMSMRNMASEINARDNPKPTYDADRGVTVDLNKGTSTPVAGIQPKDKVGDAVAIANATKGIPTYGDLHPQEHYSFGTAVGADGQPVVLRQNTSSGEITPTDVTKPASQGGSSGSAQNMQARLIAAVSEGRLADQRMSGFEQKHLKDGKLDVGTLESIGGGLASDLVGSHNPISIMLQRGSEGTMNALGQGDYLQFQRDARLTSRAEQLMSARGGSEAQANANAWLAAGGANAPEATVRAAQKSRKALWGQFGAVMQVLNDQQKAKLAKGLEALANDDPNFDYSAVGKEIAGAAPQPPATPAPGAPSKQKATTGASDPGGNITPGTDPTAGMSDADAWEHWKNSGLTSAQATAKVKSRGK